MDMAMALAMAMAVATTKNNSITEDEVLLFKTNSALEEYEIPLKQIWII